ncbi:MAG: hypothetical protein M1819_002840 [Sarea resinae]|nr:MAG: hypothetical protein M1819_002840 [Sarea resinae]
MASASTILIRPSICRNCCRTRIRNRRGYATAATKTPEIFDVVCVGGGPAGLSLLTALRSSKSLSNLKIALVEGQDLNRIKQWNLPLDQYSNRVSSLTPSSAAFLKEIGAWQHLKQPRIQPYNGMQVWDGVTDARISFDWPSAGGISRRTSSGGIVAYMVENLNITSAILSRLEELGGLTIFDNSRVQNIQLGGEDESGDLSSWPVIELSTGKRLAARLLVGADGANSPVRSFANIESRGWSYDRHGVVATLRLEGEGWGGASQKIAYQRFLPTGPVAMLPLPGNRCTLVWSTLPSHAAHLKSLSPSDFCAMVNAAFRLDPVDLAYMHTQPQGQVDELEWREQNTKFEAELIPQRVVDVQEGTVASFPLRLTHADTYTGERVALVGDAAHTTHPLAGQGLNQGQEDVKSLVRTICAAAEHGQDIGTQLALENYNAERYAANHVMLGVCDKIHKLYSVSSGPLVPLRSFGLNAIDFMSPLKSFFMNQAAGINRIL